MNRIELIGRIANEVKREIPEQEKNKPLVIILAVDRRKKNEDGTKNTDFVLLKAFGKTAEIIREYKLKGDELFIEGHISAGFYDKDGKRNYYTDNIIDRVSFLRSVKRETETEKTETEEDYQEVTSSIVGDLPFIM